MTTPRERRGHFLLTIGVRRSILTGMACKECAAAVEALVGPEPPAGTDEECRVALKWAKEVLALEEARHIIHRKAPAWLEPRPRQVGPDLIE
jgi:hypothetical protein